jgi:hypothetical protein
MNSQAVNTVQTCPLLFDGWIEVIEMIEKTSGAECRLVNYLPQVFGCDRKGWSEVDAPKRIPASLH